MEDRSLDDFLGDGPDDGEETVVDESLDQSDEPGDDEPGDDEPGDDEPGDDERPDDEVGDDAVDAGAVDRENGEVSVDTDEGGAGGESDGTETGDADTDEQGPRVDPSTVEPAESTYAWSRDGGACAACGETVDRRWRSDDGLVCVDCKAW